MQEEDPRDPTKREFQRFHTLWVLQQMPVMWDVVETAEEVVMDKNVVAKVPVQPCLGRHQRMVPARN